MTIYQGLESLQTFWFVSEHDTWWDWVLLRTNRLALFKAWEPKTKTAEKQLKLELAKAESILLWHSSLQNLPNGIDSWFQQLYLMASLRMSRRSGQIELKSCVHLTDRIANFATWTVPNCCINWHLTLAKCAVPSGLSHCLCCNKRAVRICVAGCFNWTEGDPSLVSVTLHSRITLSPATCHPIQCRANMRVADCSTVWVCKCLQLIYPSALHLTLFDIYSAI